MKYIFPNRFQHYRYKFGIGFFLGCRWKVFVFIGALCITGCKQDFTPLEPNDQYAFSMYGWLDVHSDTQWVRIMPIGEVLIPTDPSLPAAEVTLTREHTGERRAMKDSLFRFGGNTYVWNYWTDFTIYPNEVYTIRAASGEGEMSMVTVDTPSEISQPDAWTFSEERESGMARGTSPDPFISVYTRYIVQRKDESGVCQAEEEIFLSHIEDMTMNREGEYYIPIENERRLISKFGRSPYQVNKRELILVSKKDSWPDLEGLSLEEMMLPDAVLNVEHGTGYVAGIAQRIVELTPKRDPCGN